MSRDDDTLSRFLGRGRRRKQRNLDALTPPGGAIGASDAGDGGGDSGGSTDTGGGQDECGGGLLGCEELAAAEVCLPSGSGAASEQVGCVLDLTTAELSEGDTVAWAADVKCETANEVNDAGTLKMTDNGLLARDALDTLDDVTVEAGTVEIVNGKLRCAADGEWRYTGISNRAEIVAQVRKQSDEFSFVDHHFVGRLDANLDGYSVQQASTPEDSMWDIDGGTENGQLGSDSSGGVKESFYRDVYKIHVKDDQQRGRVGSDATSQDYDFTATDATHNSKTGTAGAVADPTAPHVTIFWDLILCPNDEITCSSLPTGYSIRVGDLSATESAGTATLDLEGTLYPSPFPLEVLDGSGDVVDAWSPPGGFFGGAVFEYSSGGAFSADDATGQIDVDFFQADGTLISTSTSPTTTSPTYKRLSGTDQIPIGTQYIAPTLRRAGTDTATVCARRVVLRAGISAPWIPCEDDPSTTATNRCGELPVILNDEFLDNGAYWVTHPGNSGAVRFTSLTIGNIEFDFSGASEFVFAYQTTSPDEEIDKSTNSEVPVEPIRYLKVCPDDVLTIAAEFVKENPGDSTDFDLKIWEYDANKEQVGSTVSGVLQWLASEDGSRKQLTYSIGETEDDADRQSIRYVSFGIEATGDAGETSGLLYITGWRNVPDFHASATIEMDGTNADFTWRSRIPARMKYTINTTGHVHYEDIEASGTWNPGASALQRESTVEDALTGLSSGDVIYLTMVPYDRDSFRRSGKIVHQTFIVP